MGFFKRVLTDTALDDAGTFVSDSMFTHNYDKICFQWDTLGFGSAAATAHIDIRTHEYAGWAHLQVAGSDVDIPLSAASGAIDSTGKLTFTSVSADSSGNEIVVILEDTGVAGAEEVTVVREFVKIEGRSNFYSSSTITVSMEAGVSTADQIKTALDGSAEAAALISTAVTTADVMGVGSAILTGGSFVYDLDTAAYQVRARITVSTAEAGGVVRGFISAKF